MIGTGGPRRYWLPALTSLVLAAAPAAAVPPSPAVVGPGASGFVLVTRTRPKDVGLAAFVVEPVGVASLRMRVETCTHVCTADDRTIPGTLEFRGSTQVLVRGTHPVWGQIALDGRWSQSGVGTYAQCSVVWQGEFVGIDAAAADFHRPVWSGRFGSWTVRPLSGNPCAFAHQAGVLVVR